MKTPSHWLFFVLPFLFLHCSETKKQTSPAASITVTDDLNRQVSLPGRPARIVSLAPSITETLFALGLDSAVVGVTDYCDFPAAAKSKTRIGGLTSPDFEAIVSLHPDLVIMTTAGNSRQDFEKLVSLGITTFVSNPRTIDDIERSILTLGRLCSRAGEGEELVQQMRHLKDSVVQKRPVKPQRVLLLLSLHPLVSAGQGTFVNELMTLGNMTNVIQNAPTSYPLLSREEVLTLQPDWIVVTRDVAPSLSEIVHAYPEWKSLRAIREKHVSLVDPDLISRPGPRIIRGLEALVRAVEP